MGKLTCQDLMVGDWVNYKSPTSGELRPIKIKNIYGCEFNCELEYWEIISGKSISDLYPLELTEEILVKNGFEKTTNDWNRHGRPLIIFESMGFPTISIHADMDMKHFWVHGTIDLTYVHQLQHLLRLVGVQKEIKL